MGKIMKIVIISGSPRKVAKTQILMKYVYEYTKTKNQDTKLINLSDGNIECYKGLMRSTMKKQRLQQMTLWMQIFG